MWFTMAEDVPWCDSYHLPSLQNSDYDGADNNVWGRRCRDLLTLDNLNYSFID